MNFKLVSIAVTVHFKEVEVENVTLFAARLQFFLLLFDVSHYVRLQLCSGAVGGCTIEKSLVSSFLHCVLLKLLFSAVCFRMRTIA